MYLDEERNSNCGSCGAELRRDEGDGSSSGTNVDESGAMPPSSEHPQGSPGNQLFNDEGMSCSVENTL